MFTPRASASTSSGCAYSRSIRSRTRRNSARSRRRCAAAGLLVTCAIVPRRADLASGHRPAFRACEGFFALQRPDQCGESGLDSVTVTTGAPLDKKAPQHREDHFGDLELALVIPLRWAK